jgi:hypothetical protein
MDSHDDDASWGKLQTRPSKLSGNPTSGHLGQVEGMDNRVRILPISIQNTSRNL